MVTSRDRIDPPAQNVVRMLKLMVPLTYQESMKRFVAHIMRLFWGE